MRKITYCILILTSIAACIPATGKEMADSLTVSARKVDFSRLKESADSLTKAYKFNAAVELLQNAKEAADSADAVRLDEMMVPAQNGSNMTGFCSNPVPVAKERFSLKDFFLYYPLQDRSWRITPNQLDSTANDPFAKAIYIPDDVKQIYWSGKDSDGIRNIYRTALGDSLWTVPELVNEQLTSSSDEIYPMISPDGKQLFFASKGLYGMGGYDLYVSNWDKDLNDWGVPVNMGFPYSSPYDDFLYINTADGKYSMFASNRECPADSVDIYVLEFDSMPVRKEINDPDELKKLCSLAPDNDPTRIDNHSATTDEDGQNNADMSRYSEQMLIVRSLRDSIYKFSTDLDRDRSWLSETSGEERSRLAASILSKEAMLPKLQDSLARASRELQKIELEFLQSGIVIDPEKIHREADRELVGADAGYTFSKKSPGARIRLDMEKPAPSFDYTFQILEQGRFAEDNTIPQGLYYQIQLFSMMSKATVKQIKGLSPVFERPGSNGRRIYSVGLFHTYKDVLANLNKVKRAGFRSAIIVAFLDGKPITVQKARAIEKNIHELFQIRVFPIDGNSLNENEIATIKASTDSDMSKTTEGGMISYILGPYDSRQEADTVTEALKKAGLSNLRIESAGLSKAE